MNEEPVTDDRELTADEVALLQFKALSDPVRLMIFSVVAATGKDGLTVEDITTVVPVAQPTVSFHLKKLAMAGLVNRKKIRTFTWNTVDPDSLATTCKYLLALAGE